MDRRHGRQAVRHSRTLRVGLTHHQAGRLDRAEALYRKILLAEPEHADALHLLGVLAFQCGKMTTALQLIERALPALATLPEIHLNYRNVLRSAGRAAEAVASYRRAVALEPDHGMAHNNLARALIDMGAAGAALESAGRAVELIPDFAGAHANHAGALLGLGRFVEAEAALRRALAIAPDDAALHLDLGYALHQQKRLDETVAAYRRVLEMRSDLWEAHNNLGCVLTDLKRPDEATVCFAAALRLAPDKAATLHNLGKALRDQHRLDAAVSCFRQAVALRPDLATAHLELGRALAKMGVLDAAASALGRAAQQLDHATIELFWARRRMCDWDLYSEAEADARQKADTQVFLLLAVDSSPAEQLDCARRAAAAMALPRPSEPPRAQIKRGQRLRIGYVSANFRAHAGAFLISGLIEQHDRQAFEIIGYSASPDDGSQNRARLVSAFDRFVEISRTTDRDAAATICADAVDILVDLNGHTSGGRLALFAHRPAPVQVSYLGHPATTGAEFMDYILVDPFVAPADQQPFYSERLVQLPDCYQCNDDRRPISGETPSRAACGLPDDGFVFCCFNNPAKITPDLFDTWMGLLVAVPGSVIWLFDDNPWAKAGLAREAANRGVAPERLVFAPRLPLPEHLARHRLADLFLDTLPFNAHTTPSDALWAGLPIVTCPGTTFASRVAGSLLHAIGMPDLVVGSLQDYETLALRIARDRDLRAALRARLERNRRTSALFDSARLARNIETAYRRMWEIRRAGRGPKAFSVLSRVEP
ncbi:MAG TPA: tetratricopeptide repeat protein [Roseiarcus sp.]|nr:tetratricopeptide repeat protein [Roseiarcus sp.]